MDRTNYVQDTLKSYRNRILFTFAKWHISVEFLRVGEHFRQSFAARQNPYVCQPHWKRQELEKFDWHKDQWNLCRVRKYFYRIFPLAVDVRRLGHSFFSVSPIRCFPHFGIRAHQVRLRTNGMNFSMRIRQICRVASQCHWINLIFDSLIDSFFAQAISGT